MLLFEEDIKRLSVRKSKVKAFRKRQSVRKFIDDFKNAAPVFSKKQEKDLLRRGQLEQVLEKRTFEKQMSDEEFQKWKSERVWYDPNKYPPLSKLESPTSEEIDRVFEDCNKRLRKILKEIEDGGRVQEEHINGVTVYFRKRTR